MDSQIDPKIMQSFVNSTTGESVSTSTSQEKEIVQSPSLEEMIRMFLYNDPPQSPSLSGDTCVEDPSQKKKPRRKRCVADLSPEELIIKRQKVNRSVYLTIQ
jgi:hypothetical protein